MNHFSWAGPDEIFIQLLLDEIFNRMKFSSNLTPVNYHRFTLKHENPRWPICFFFFFFFFFSLSLRRSCTEYPFAFIVKMPKNDSNR